MIGVGTFEIGIGLLVAIPLVYFVFRRIVSAVVLDLLLVVTAALVMVS